MSTSPILWCQGQRDAFRKLREMAELFFFTELPDHGLHPRLNPLVAGPSGMGKSHLVRALAEDLEMPVFRVTPSSWMVSGAKDQVATLNRILAFVLREDIGIIHVDELDKFYAQTSGEWARCVRGEVFDLLDRTITPTHAAASWEDFELEKLRRNFFIVGTGTWQSLWSARPAKGPLGFGPTQSTNEDISRQIRETEQIPIELLRRFNGEIILIPPASEDDYRAAASELGLLKLAGKLNVTLDFAEAVCLSLGARWLEEQYTKLLLLAKQHNRSDLVFPRNPYLLEEEQEPANPDYGFSEPDNPAL